MYRGKYYGVPNFKGGYCGNNPPTSLQLNQAFDLDNIVIGSEGRGFRSRLGNSVYASASIYGTPFKVIQDLTYTSTSTGSYGQSVTIAYTTGGTAGAEVVTVTGTAISIKIQSGVSTATNVRTAFNLVGAATTLATCSISGTAGNTQTGPVTASNLAVTSLNAGSNVQGIGYLLTAAQATYIGAVIGTKLIRITDGQDYTGSLTITAGADDQWSMFPFQDNIVAFGGPPTSPDVPFKWAGNSNGTVLSGTPPSAYGGFAANNRVFGFRTSGSPSTIYWSIIGSADDWTGAGSGSAVVGSFSDNQRVTGAIVISTNYVLVFKEASTYQMVISAAPFPIYSMFDSVGCVGKNACLAVDGVGYWINQRGRMSSTDGENYQEYPPVADDLWNSVQTSRYPYINGFRQKGSDYDWIVWMVSTSGSTNNVAICWDLINKCWIRHTTGYKFNVSTKDNTNHVYLGGYDGRVYQPDLLYFDGSETAPGTITSYWKSGWMNLNTPEEIIQVRRFVAQFKTRSTGTVNVSYGFDFNADQYSFTFSQVPTASELLQSKRQELSRRGNFFEFKIGGSSATVDTAIYQVTLGGKLYGQKRLGST